MKNYLNNAGAGIMSTKTYEVIINYLKLEREIGAYHAAAKSKTLSDNFYINAAKLINANSPSEIAYMDSASRGWNMIVYGTPLKKGDTILTLSSEFGTNLITLFNYAKLNDFKVCVIKCDINGSFLIEEIENKLKEGAKLIAISHAVAHGSIINPVEEIGKLAKKYGAYYIVDGCQTVGQIKVDVQSIQCDAYMTTGRKWLCGPRGTGFLYVKSSSQMRTTQLDLASADLIFDDNLNLIRIEVRNDAKQFELWEKSFANLLGLSSAIEECLESKIEVISVKIQELSNKLRFAASSNENIKLIGKTISLSGILGFYLDDYSKESYVQNEFDKFDLRISTMSDWDCPMHFPKNGANKIFRLSPHFYTDNDTIEKACEIISKI
jgi:cysteine desulfurase / selenocysteine lyase